MTIRKMKYTIMVILLALIFTVELKVIEVIRSNEDRRNYSSDKDEIMMNKISPKKRPALKNALRNEMFDNYAGKFSEVDDRVEEVMNPVSLDKSNGSSILKTFVKNIRRHTSGEPIDASTEKLPSSDEEEIMETAEMYLRPLSRYRELQEKRKNHTLDGINNNHVESKRGTLLFKSPEYCLPTREGLVCFYKV